MTVLHLVSRSPGESRALDRCIERLGHQDYVLLIENGVYGALCGCPGSASLNLVDKGRVFVLDAHFNARGLCRSGLRENVVMTDYSGFVELAVRCPRSVSWT